MYLLVYKSMAINELEWGNLGLKMTYNSLQADYKVAGIKVGHTLFLPILANRAVYFGVIFMKIGMYVYF